MSVIADDQQKTVGTDDPAFTYRAGCASGQSVDCGLVDGERSGFSASNLQIDYLDEAGASVDVSGLARDGRGQ